MSRMNWKIFKPTIGNILLFLVLIVGLNYWIISTTYVFDGVAILGIPLGFYPKGSVFIRQYNPNYPPINPVGISWVNFVIDLMFWYIVSCISFYIVDLVRKL